MANATVLRAAFDRIQCCVCLRVARLLSARRYVRERALVAWSRLCRRRLIETTKKSLSDAADQFAFSVSRCHMAMAAAAVLSSARSTYSRILLSLPSRRPQLGGGGGARDQNQGAQTPPPQRTNKNQRTQSKFS